ncbi:MAG: B12-binding domain-containing radical SAM protein [Syntrophales bacterium]|nr:B12-binding domain-containing radical SAM protein [Syntrophales bacterium]
MRSFLLVNPWITDFAAYDFWVRPLGLYTLAALFRAAGHRVELIDCLEGGGGEARRPPKRGAWGQGKFFSEEIARPHALRFIRKRYRRYGMTPARFRERLAAGGRPDAVLVSSMMTYWYPGVVEAIREIRGAWPGVPVILGGNYATLCEGHARAFSGADRVSAGDGERVLPPVLADLLGGTFDLGFDGGDLDSYPYPALELAGRLDAVPVLTSRGCPCRCTYCASALLNRGFRVRNPVRVADEIEHWHRRHGVVDFAFYDDALLVDAPRRAVPMLEDILRRGLACRFHCPNGLHVREMSPRIASLLFRTGFRTIRFGFETASAARQESTGGKVTTAELRQAVAYLREAGYESRDIGVYLLCGLPGQPYREMEAGIDLVAAAGARPILAEYSPIPGTPLWGEALGHARYDVAGEPLFQNNTLLPCLHREIAPGGFQALKTRARESAVNEGSR